MIFFYLPGFLEPWSLIIGSSGGISQYRTLFCMCVFCLVVLVVFCTFLLEEELEEGTYATATTCSLKWHSFKRNECGATGGRLGNHYPGPQWSTENKLSGRERWHIKTSGLEILSMSSVYYRWS